MFSKRFITCSLIPIEGTIKASPFQNHFRHILRQNSIFSWPKNVIAECNVTGKKKIVD